MALQAGDYSYMGIGRVFMRERGAAAPLLHIGNISVLNFGVEEDVKEQRDYTVVGGGQVADVRRIASVDCSMTLLDLDHKNIARAFFGTASEVVAGTVTDESHTAYAGGFLPTAKPIDTTATVTVKEGVTTLVAGTDYTVSSAGITAIVGGAIGNGDTILISYSSLAYGNVEAITTASKEYELHFEGLNEAKSGRAFHVQAYRVKFGATQVLDLITEDFASFEVKGSLLRDNTKTGNNISKFFKAQIVGE